jgi:XTP/dITP diphosphohydrolase
LAPEPSSTAQPTLLLATRSGDKLREIRQILAPAFRGRIITLDEAGIAESADEAGVEAFDTFLANAHAKADYFLRRSGLPTLADDSGICVDALGGAPGVRSKRFAADAGSAEGDADAANNQRLLRDLDGVTWSRRTAHYTCAAVLHLPDGRRVASVGTCTGIILDEFRGSGGFGYDPLFLDPDTGLSFAELDAAAKNRKSHRARAFRGLAANMPGFTP